MATVTFKKDLTVHLSGEMPTVGTTAPNFGATKTNLSEIHLEDLRGQRVVLNIFPSVDTGVCATSVLRFNAEASKLDNTVVLCVSKDLPFAQSRFCGAEGLDKVVPVSVFRHNCFTEHYGLEQQDGPLAGLLTVKGDEDLMIITDTGVMIRTNVANISQTGRSTMGVKVMRLDQDAKIVTFTTVAAAEKEEVATEERTEGEA